MAAEELTPETVTDIGAMLADCPAFTGVGQAALWRIARDAELVYLAGGDDLPPELATVPLVVARGALLVRDAEDRTIDLVGRGEFSAPAARRTALEDGLLVLLPEAAIDLAWSAPPAALRAAVAPGAEVVDLSTAPVRAAMRRGLITVQAADTCRVAAERMREHGVSAVVLTGGPEPAILTDRDLRNRLIAEGGSPDTPASTIASVPMRTIAAATSQFEALLEMLAAGVHHLPVTERGRLVGMVSAGDLLRRQRTDPLHLRALLDRAEGAEGLAAAAGTLPAMAETLLAAGTSAGAVARILAAVTDRIDRRLLAWCEDELGPAPAPYGWLAFGSQGRREQTLVTDQDTGLLLPRALDPDAAAWFARLGAAMTDALEACGYPRCRGGVMAANADWRHDTSGWERRFMAWMEEPTGKSLLGASIAFDVRTAAGDLDSETALRPIIARSAARPLFLAHLAREAVGHGPPLGFLGRRVVVARSGEHAGSFDIKAGALLPLVDIARLHTLARRGAETGTDERLEAAAADGRVSADLASTLRAGFELALRLRLESQVRDLRDGVEPDNWIQPDALPPLIRSQLREVFRAIRLAQDAVGRRYRVSQISG